MIDSDAKPIPTDRKIRVLIAMGTRPEIIKLAPIVWAAREHESVEAIICHSGQHADLAEPMLDYFGVKPDIHLNLMRLFATLPSMFGGCMQMAEKAFAEHSIDVVAVQGDTGTSAAMALAAFYSRLPVVHVEAGLRTGDLHSPWPEELNRRVATLATDLHCAPTQRAADQLESEGVPPEKIFLSGNPIVDALQWTINRESTNKNGVTGAAQVARPIAGRNTTATMDPHQQPLVVVTAHRRENFGKPLEDICSAVLELSNKFSDHRFVFVTHPNPKAGPVVRSILAGESRIELAPPMSYPEFIELMRCSRLVISDSGGIQEEAPTLSVPLLVTRISTERPEAVQCGAAELVGSNRELIVSRASSLLNSEAERQKMASAKNPFGSGNSGVLIVDEIVRRYGARSD